MTGVGVDVEIRASAAGLVPDDVRLGAIALMRFAEENLPQRLERLLPLSRYGGYQVVPLFAAATVVLCAGPRWGIRPLLQNLGKQMRKRLGRVFGVTSLPSSSSMSRALCGLSHNMVRPFVRGLLASSVDEDMVRHPAVHHLDSYGNSWHVVDIDPTVDAFRQRDQNDEPERAEPFRRAPGEPGYTGRKRGELRTRVIPALHDGSGLWLAMQLVAREGSVAPIVGTLATDAVNALCGAGVDSQRVIMRGDGEFGSVVSMHAIAESGAHLVTRLCRYSLLDRDEVVANMPTLQWHLVRPGESGVRREAAELGTFTFRGCEEHAHLQVTVRVIVTRFKRSSKPEHGVLRDGYQLELFATTLDSAPWPAPDIAELYSGRAVVENRYAQEDREFGMGRTYCHNPAGQEWMVGVGLYLWNDQVITGWRSKPPPRLQRAQTDRPAPQVSAPTPDLPLMPPPTCAAPAGDNTDEGPSVQHEDDHKENVEPVASVSATAIISPIVRNAFADVLTQPGWGFEPTTASLICPWNKRLFPYSSTGISAAGAPRLSVRTEPYACQGCPTQEGCFPSDRRSPYKQIARKLAPEVQVQVAALLKPRKPPLKLTRSWSADKGEGKAPMRPFREPPTISATPGPWWCEAPRFLPATARAIARKAAHGLTIVIELRRVQRRRPHDHPLVAPNSDARAHRRKTLEALAQVRRAPKTSVIIGIEKCAA
jgi:hypothetical protein